MLISAVIAACGKGSRVKNAGGPKQFYVKDDKSVLLRAVEPFERSRLINEIIVVTLFEYIGFCEKELAHITKLKKITVGGETRQQSVFNGLCEACADCELVLVHDAARPFVSDSDIESVIRMSVENDNCAATIGRKSVDTVKLVDSLGYVTQTPDRERLWTVQTPQAVPYGVFLKAHKKAHADGFLATDDVSLAEYIGYPVRIAEGSAQNIKITYDADFELLR